MTHTRGIIAIVILFSLGIPCFAQNPNPQPQVFGISISPDGVIEFRQRDAQSELSKLKSRKVLKESATDLDKRLKFVSLVKITSELRNTIESNKALADD